MTDERIILTDEKAMLKAITTARKVYVVCDLGCVHVTKKAARELLEDAKRYSYPKPCLHVRGVTESVFISRQH